MFSRTLRTVVLTVLTLVAFTSRSAVVSNLTQRALQAAIINDGNATFSLSGTIVLTNTVRITQDTIIDGTGQNIVISGSNAVRVFFVTNSATLTLLNIGIADGKSTNGAGIFNAGGTVNLSNCVVTANLALGTASRDGKETTRGGGTGGSASSGSIGMGGGIFNLGVVNAERTSFFGNAASGSNGGAGGDGGEGSLFGGAGGNGGSGAKGFGGGIYNKGTLVLTKCSFQANIVAGGDGGAGGNGGSGGFPGRPGAGGRGASGSGGGIYNLGTVTIDDSTFSTNSALAGDSAQTSPRRNGKVGGVASGGAIFNLGTFTLRNCTLTENFARGGKGGDVLGRYFNPGQGGSASGGAIHNSKTIMLVNCTLATNNVIGGGGGDGTNSGGDATGSTGSAGGGSIYRLKGQVFLHNTIVAKGVSGAACRGTVVDLGYNICSDNSCKFSAANHSRNSLDPRLMRLANNGGFTLTMALSTNSPAIDKGDPAICGGIDQRGTSRPQGAACDIGAFEYSRTFSVAGRITNGTNGIPGVLINVGETASTTSGTNGFFFLGGLMSGDYLVTPQATGTNFTPASQTVFIGTNSASPILGINATNVFFIALPSVTLPPIIPPTNSPPNPPIIVTNSPPIPPIIITNSPPPLP